MNQPGQVVRVIPGSCDSQDEAYAMSWLAIIVHVDDDGNVEVIPLEGHNGELLRRLVFCTGDGAVLQRATWPQARKAVKDAKYGARVLS